LTGPETLRGHVRPQLDAGAADAGQPRPEVVCGLPVCVTDDPSDARRRITHQFAEYSRAPSYRRMMDREQAGGPADVALVGSEQEITAAVFALSDAGADELLAVMCGTERERERTRELLASRLGVEAGVQ
jgi:alkanesulfonate monooxygenase SsuD/methylene tetrahydromethanopterin reductase-like flavin-dependent oxidoreductase (luciferase family)